MPHRITNVSTGPRILRPAGRGAVTLGPGKSYTGEFAAPTLERMGARKADYTIAEISDQVAAKDAELTRAPDEFDGMDDDQLRDFIERRGGKAPRANARREALLARARGEGE